MGADRHPAKISPARECRADSVGAVTRHGGCDLRCAVANAAKTKLRSVDAHLFNSGISDEPSGSEVMTALVCSLFLSHCTSDAYPPLGS
jgi:hypothetical protein